MDPKLKKWVYVGAAIVIALIVLIVIRWRRSLSKYTYADITAGTGPPETTTYSNIISCQVAYNTANVTATDVTRPGFMTTFTNCVRSNVNTYVDNKCPWINTNPINTDGNAYTAYQTFTTNTNSIKTAYADLITRATESASFSPSLAIVEAALKADLTGATRKYLASVCTDYFKPGGSATDPTPTYSAWSVVTGSTTPTQYSFYAGSNGVITASQVNTWATKAATYTVDSATNEFTVGTPYVASGSSYNQDTTITDPFATVTGTKYKNWEIARDNGPGTINPQA